MGRLADSWAGRKITQRIPYMMAGERTLTGSVNGSEYPEGTFLQNVDMPFEVHRCKPFVVGLDAQGTVLATEPDQELLQSLVRVRITRIGGTVTLTKSPTLLVMLTKGTAERTWEFAEPDTIVRQEGYTVTLDTLVIPTFNPAVASMRICFMFQGFLLQVAPPSENR